MLKALAAVLAPLILVVAIATVFASFTTVGAGQRGVIVRLGNVQDRVLDEGFHLKTPFIEKVKKMDVTTNKIETTASAASKDLQTVDTIVALNYAVNPESANIVYQEFRKDYQFRLIDPAIQEAVKAATAKFTAEEVITKRPEVKEQMVLALEERLASNGIIVKDVSIVDFDFSDAFNRAIESKQVAEQRALEAERDLQRIEVEAQQTIVAAQAEAESIRIQVEAITKQGGDNYIDLVATHKWNGVLPSYMGTGDAMPFLKL